MQSNGKAMKDFGNIAQPAFKLAALGVAAVGGAILTGVKRFDTLNNAARSFENMGVAKGVITKEMNNLKGAIEGLPTPLDDAVSSTQMLTSTMNGDMPQSVKVYKALNDGILGFGGSAENVKTAVVQLSQGFANNKVGGQEWLSMMNNGLGPALNAMAKNMGMTTGELKDGLSEGRISVEEFQNQLIRLDNEGGGGMKSLSKIAADSTKGIGTSFANLKTSIAKFGAEILAGLGDRPQKAIEAVRDKVADLAAKAKPATEQVVQVLDRVWPVIKKIIEAMKPFAPVGAVLVAFMGSLVIVGGAFERFGRIATGVGTLLSSSFKMVNGVFKLTLGGWATIIMALVSVFTYFYTTNKTFRDTVNKIGTSLLNLGKQVLDKLQPAFEKMQKILEVFQVKLIIVAGKIMNVLRPSLEKVGKVVDDLKGVFSEVKNTISGFFDGLFSGGENVDKDNPITKFVNAVKDVALPYLKDAIAFIKSIISQIVVFWKENGNDIMQAVTTVFDYIVGAIKNAMDFIWPIVQTAFNLIMKIVSTSMPQVLQVISAVWNQIKNVIQTSLNIVMGIIKIVTGLINGNWSKVWEGVKQVVKAAWDYIINTIKNVLSILTAYVTIGFNAIKIVIQEVWDAISKKIAEVLNPIKEKIVSVFNSIKETTKNVWDSIYNAIKNAVDNIVTFFNTAWNGLQDVVRTVFEGIRNVIQTVFVPVANVVKSVIDTIVSIFKLFGALVLSVLAIVFVTIANTVMSGLKIVIDLFNQAVDGWVAIFNKVKDFIVPPITAAFNKIKSVVDNAMFGIKTVFINTWQSIVNFIQPILIAISSVISSIFNSIKNTTVNIWNAVKQVITNAVNGIKNTVTSVFSTVQTIATNIWNAIKDTITKAINAAKTTVTNVVNAIKNTVSSVFNSVKASATNVWNGIRSTISNSINAAKNAVSSAINAIKGFFSGLSLKFPSLDTSMFTRAKDAIKGVVDTIKGFFSNLRLDIPKPKFPHVSVNGGKAPFGIGGKGSLPSFDVQWYAKGGIMENATAFGVNGNNLMVGGEAGREAILPLNRETLGQIGDQIVASTSSMGSGELVFNQYNYSPENLTPRESARMARKAGKDMVQLLRRK